MGLRLFPTPGATKEVFNRPDSWQVNCVLLYPEVGLRGGLLWRILNGFAM